MEQELPFLKYPGATLSDRDIRLAFESGFLPIKSPCELSIQPASIDVHLSGVIAVFTDHRHEYQEIDLKKPMDEYITYIDMDPENGYLLPADEFILGVTREWFAFPSQLCGNLDGKSSLARTGLVIHLTAGFFDPGFSGHGTLEIKNLLTRKPIRIYPHMPIGQMRFSVLSSPAQVTYGDPNLGSKQYRNPFSDNPRPIASQFHKNFQNGLGKYG